MKNERRIAYVIAFLTLFMASLGFGSYLLQVQNKETLVISTTTSLYDTGLLDVLKSDYELTHDNVLLAFISAGTGIAITHAMNGDADAILVHSPAQERSFMEQGYGVNRKIFAYNFFTIVGPSNDPAGIRNMSAIQALSQIYNYGHSHNTSIWVSRDDRSGTNSREILLWNQTGFDIDDLGNEAWFISSGSGMGSTLQLADELGLYTLSDIGTFLKLSKEGLIELEDMVQSGESLINVYSAISVSTTHVETNMFELTMEFIQWIIGNEAQEIIESYGQEDYNQSLFNSAAGIVQSQSPIETYNWINQSAFFEVGGIHYECPPAWRQGDFGLYSLSSSATEIDAEDYVIHIMTKKEFWRRAHDSID
ncbi:MAG: substrate-binding domain-containing protein [Candidatus Thorarchaeota archaeon]|jgi:tungstate transport system substrate-binding protein